MQKLETFFGCRVTIGHSISKRIYDVERKKVQEALNKSGVDESGFEIYICQFIVESVRNHFDNSHISKKLANLDISLKVGKKQQLTESLYFVHDRFSHRINGNIKEKSSQHEVLFSVGGAYFEDKNDFSELIYVVASKKSRPNDRILQAKFIASPTSAFASRLRNVRTVSTNLPLALSREIQFRFDI